LLGVLRDRQSYPLYHFGYLLSGIVFALLGMLFLLLRHGIVLQAARSGDRSFPGHHHEPNHADQAE
jgi:hypothetical protein